MGTTSEKLTYLAETKSQLKDMINYGLDDDNKITSSTTFRNYVKSIFKAFLESLNNPSTLFNNLPKVEGEGTEITLDDTAEAPMTMKLAPSELSQDGEPTPETPQDIHTISGDNEIKVENKNLFDKNSITLGGNWNGAIGTICYPFTSTTTRATILVPVKSNTNYYLKLQQSEWYIMQIMLVDSNYVVTSNVSSNVENNTNRLITTSNDTAYIGIKFKYGSAGTTTMTSDLLTSLFLQLELGSTASPYVEHQEQSLPLNLNDLEYSKIGDYEDEFVYNTTDTSLELNKWYLKKNVGKITNLTDFTSTNFTDLYFSGNSAIATKYATQKAYFNMFKNVENQNITTNATANSYLNNGEFSFRWDASTESNRNRIYVKTTLTVEQLNNLDKILYIMLKTPEYIPLNDTLQSQLTEIYKWVKAYQDQTNISQVNNDLPFVIKVSAIRDMSDIFDLISGTEL